MPPPALLQQRDALGQTLDVIPEHRDIGREILAGAAIQQHRVFFEQVFGDVLGQMPAARQRMRRNRPRRLHDAHGSDIAHDGREIGLRIPAQAGHDLGHGAGKLGIATEFRKGRGTLGPGQHQWQIGRRNTYGDIRLASPLRCCSIAGTTNTQHP